MKDGIVIEYGGKRYEFNNYMGVKSCLISENCDKCRKNNPIIHSLCVQTVAMSDMHCTSCIPIVEEAKVYGSHNRYMANHLIGKIVETWCIDTWGGGRLDDISTDSADPCPFEVMGLKYPIIRERPTRRLTWSEIQAKYPDELGDVELIEEAK